MRLHVGIHQVCLFLNQCKIRHETLLLVLPLWADVTRRSALMYANPPPPSRPNFSCPPVSIGLNLLTSMWAKSRLSNRNITSVSTSCHVHGDQGLSSSVSPFSYWRGIHSY
jgi:hypothetical protein